MASLPTRTTASFDAIKPVSSLVLLDDELNDIKGATGFLNGGTTGKKLLVKTSDAADPPIECDQVGAGPIAEWKQNGTLKVSINNTGQVVSAVTAGDSPLIVASTTVVTNLNADKVDGLDLEGNKTAWSVSWYIADPSTFPTGDDSDLPQWIVPAGNTIAVTKVKVVFRSGSHTSGGDITFAHIKRNSSGGSPSFITGIDLDNTNNTLGQVYSADFAASLTEGDQISVQISARSGTISERKVTISLHGTQKFTT